MIPNNLLSDNGGGGSGGLGNLGGLVGMRPTMMLGANQNMATQGTNALLANQALLIAQLQNNLASQQTLLQQARSTSSCNNNNGNGTEKGPSNDNLHPDKYTAFGQFLATSLNDLDDTIALDLIAKFTIEMVDALRHQKREQAAAASVSSSLLNDQMRNSVSVQQHQQQQQQQQPQHEPQNHMNSNHLSANIASNLHHSLGDDKYPQQF